MTLLTTLHTQMTYHYVMLVGSVAHTAAPLTRAPKVRCDWSRQLMPSLNTVAGNVMGLTLSFGVILWFVALALFIILAATRHSRFLTVVAIGVFVGGLLLRSGFAPISSPC